jgi:rhodanese-related sulfurtransferase
MKNVDEILKNAHKRAQENGAAYEGTLLPSEAQEVLSQHPQARLVDVRSRAELDFVGRIPDSLEVEWKTYPGMKPNLEFLQQLAHKAPPDALLLFICRSGGRSHEAALAAAGIGRKSYNVLEGFEGDCDSDGHRNSVGGWRKAGLPWRQS